MKVIRDEKNHIIHSIELENEKLSKTNKSINNFIEEQYKKNSYVNVEELKKIENLLNSLNEEQWCIINAYSEIKNYKINSLDEIKELIANINEYRILEIYSLEEIGKILIEKEPDYEITEEMESFVDYTKLAEHYLNSVKIKQDFCSYGLLVNTRNVLENCLIEEKIEKDKMIKATVVNKKDFNKLSHWALGISICFPIDKKILKEKLKSINVDYDNLSNEDTHILHCSLVNYENEELGKALDYILERIILDSEEKYDKTTSLQDIEKFYQEISKFDYIMMNKFLAIAEVRLNEIRGFGELLDCIKEAKQYEVLPDVKNYEELGEYLVNETGHFDDLSLLYEYIDYEKLAKDYTKKGCTYNGDFTKYGFVFKKEDLENEVSNNIEDEEEI